MIKGLVNKGTFQNKKLTTCFQKFSELLEELKEREISAKVLDIINHEIDLINSIYEEKPLKKQIYKSQYKIIHNLEREHKIVPKNFYRNKWMVLGMTIFGLPFGVVFGSALGNMAFIGIGLPIGMPIGMAVGAKKDAEAAKNGLQLNFQWG